MSRRSRNKREVNDYEFREGYALVHDEMIDAIITAYREKTIRKDELRVIAGLLELSKLHASSRVDLYEIVNRKTAKKKHLKRMTHREIELARNRVCDIVEAKRSGKRSAVSRRFLRYIARGNAACSQALLLLFYCKRRIRQLRAMMPLCKKERYARFKYKELAEAAKFRRATLCDAMKKLLQHGLLAVVSIPKQNENRYGQLYVDGYSVSLTREYGDETVTGVEENRNATADKSGTLINGNPKTQRLCFSTRTRHQRLLEDAAADRNHIGHGTAVRALVRQSLESAIAV